MEKGIDLQPGASLQKVIHFDLKEEGNHVLAVTVAYTENVISSGDGKETVMSARVRNFRKLYQFVCKGCMVVRTKTGALPSGSDRAREGEGDEEKGRGWVLEAQLENTGEETIVLDMVVLEARKGFRGRGVNWDVPNNAMGNRRKEDMERPVLMPGDVEQVYFVVEEVDDDEEEKREEEEGGGYGEGEKGKEIVDGRLIFGILSIGWRGPMGNRGFLSTGSLGVRLQ